MTPIQETIINKKTTNSPIWLMRQAGRYLPEFQKVRLENPDFIKLCLDSNLSSDITLQPMSRFNLDAAIIFSDILMVPYALGQEVKFEKGKGPNLDEINIEKFLNINELDYSTKLSPVYEAIKKTKKKLNKNKSLISFVGAPWTLAVYMMGLKKEKNILDFNILKKNSSEISLIIEKINNFLLIHIKKQIEAGADVIQIFDSWAGLLPEEKLNSYCYQPNLKLVNFCKNNKIPVICFPKGIKKNYVNFLNIVKPDCLSIDYNLDPLWAKNNLRDICIQGGLDPKMLLMEEQTLFEKAEIYLKVFKDFPYIFNLGHGLLPQTNPDKLGKLINFVRNYK